MKKAPTQKETFIGGVACGDGHPAFVIAEIGSNHNQQLDLAFELIDAAAGAGVNAVKFQTFQAANHYSKKTPGFSYLDNQNTFDLIQSLELNRSWHAPLKQHAEERGLIFFSSPCDLDAVAELKSLNVPAYKVASFDLPDTGLIQAMAETGQPVILSTGMADEDDIRRGIEACRQVGNNDVILLQCTSLYPAPVGLSNLRAMATMRAEHDVLVGYSDHTLGDHISLAAVVLGACMIEKHFTLDRTLPGPDHQFAIEPDELAEMMRRLRDIESSLGDGVKSGPRPEEQEMFEKGRRSLHAKKDIPAGTIIEANMLTIKRPGLGLAPHLLRELVGKTARTEIEADMWITWNQIDNPSS